MIDKTDIANILVDILIGSVSHSTSKTIIAPFERVKLIL